MFVVFYTLFEHSIGIRAGTLILVSLPQCDPSPHIEMDWSQSLNAPPYFDGSNYAFWKVRMKAFLCSIDEAVWDAVEIGQARSEEAKSTWDKAALVASNANCKALNAIFCGVSPDEFHRISHITIAKEAWQILETTYEGMKWSSASLTWERKRRTRKLYEKFFIRCWRISVQR